MFTLLFLSVSATNIVQPKSVRGRLKDFKVLIVHVNGNNQVAIHVVCTSPYDEVCVELSNSRSIDDNTKMNVNFVDEQTTNVEILTDKENFECILLSGQPLDKLLNN